MTTNAQTAQRIAARPLPPAPGPDLPRLATLAAALVMIDDARIHGLIDGGPHIDRAQCRRTIGQAHAEGFICDPDEVAAAALSLMAELGVLRP